MKRNYAQKNMFVKLKAIEDLNNNMSIKAVAHKYGTSIGKILNWKKHSAEFVERAVKNESITKNRLTKISSILDERIYNWFSATRPNNIPISGPMIQENAKKVADILKMNKFKSSNRWLESYRKRHNISFRTLVLNSIKIL